MRRDSSFCAKSVRYNIFTNGAPYQVRIFQKPLTDIPRTKASNESVSDSSFLILSSGNGSKITLGVQRFQPLQEFFQRFAHFLLSNIQSMPGEYFIHWFEKSIVKTSHSVAVGFAVTNVRIN